MSPNLFHIDHWRRVARTRTKELSLLPAGSSFIVSIAGESLSGAAIVGGDRLSCERADEVVRGSLAIVRTPYGLLPRFVYIEPDYVRLETADHAYPTLCLARHEVEIIGRPVKLVRRFRDASGESEGA